MLVENPKEKEKEKEEEEEEEEEEDEEEERRRPHCSTSNVDDRLNPARQSRIGKNLPEFGPRKVARRSALRREMRRRKEEGRGRGRGGGGGGGGGQGRKKRVF